MPRFRQDPGPTTLVSAGSVAGSANGTYAGNDTAGRAIPHGLGAIPKMVSIVDDSLGRLWVTIDGSASLYSLQAGQAWAVTAIDATNFYVGADSARANGTGVNYYWTAFK